MLCLLLVTVLFGIVMAPPVLSSAHSLRAGRFVWNVLQKNYKRENKTDWNVFINSYTRLYEPVHCKYSAEMYYCFYYIHQKVSLLGFLSEQQQIRKT